MPAETHQLGRDFDARDVLALLGDRALTDSGRTLASFGFDDQGLAALWEAVCEEFAERSLGPELEPGTVEVSMTIDAAAATMATLLDDSADAR